MNREIYVSLPVKDVEKSREFFATLGFGFHSLFSNEDLVCMVVSEGIYVMHMTESSFQGFSQKEVADSVRTAEAIIAISVDSREAVDELATTAIKAGGRQVREPEDHGWMYGRSFEDLDGHVWEVFNIYGEAP